MPYTIQQLSTGRDNNFNLIRFVAASLVIFTHSFGITARGAQDPIRYILGLSMGSLAVDIFFVISGFLIAKSWNSKKSLTYYFYARFSRIYPAMWVATLASIIVLGLSFSSLPMKEYFLHKDVASFLIHNFTLLPSGVSTSLPGVFDNLLVNRVNTSIWTLPHELRLYILLSLLAIAGLLFRTRFLALLITVSFLVFAILHLKLTGIDGIDGEPPYAEDFSRFVFLFFCGTALYALREKVVLHIYPVIACLAIIVAITFVTENLEIRRVLTAALLPYLVAYIAFVPKGFIRNFNKVGDYSYGLYIYAFPVQQCVQTISGGTSSYANFIISFFVTLVFAILSWHMIEERALKHRHPNFLSRIDSLEKRIFKK